MVSQSLFLRTLLLVASVSAFSSQQTSQWRWDAKLAAISDESTRRSFLATTVSTAILTSFSRAAFADVSDGNQLPPGAAQFAKVVRIKSDIPAIQKRIKEGGSSIDKSEWNNIGQFMRKIYSSGDDIKSIASSLTADKVKTADGYIVELRKYSKAGETPVAAQDGDATIAVLGKCEVILGDFFDLLQDIPDEI